MTAPLDIAQIAREVLRRQTSIRDICEDGDPANQENYDRLRSQNATDAPALARAVIDLQEKLKKANEALLWMDAEAFIVTCQKDDYPRAAIAAAREERT